MAGRNTGGNLDPCVIPLRALGMGDVHRVGGKNASLGELIGQLSALGLRVPDGFATTADAYRQFLAQDGLGDRIDRALSTLDVGDLDALTRTGRQIRDWVLATALPPALVIAIGAAWQEMATGHPGELAVAVRSSATAEDLPEAWSKIASLLAMCRSIVPTSALFAV